MCLYECHTAAGLLVAEGLSELDFSWAMQYAAHLLGGTGSLRLLVFQESYSLDMI